MANRITWENAIEANAKVVVVPTGKNYGFQSVEGFALYSKSRLTCYVFSDDATMDVFRKHLSYWKCLGVRDQKWEIRKK